MKTLHKSNYYEILFDEKTSLIVHKALPGTAAMRDEDFKLEMTLFVEMCEKYSPVRDLVNLVEMQYPIAPDMQEWVNAEIFPRFVNIVKRMALVMPTGVFESLALEQTMEEESGKKFVRQYFESETKALDWLMQYTLQEVTVA